MQAHLARKAVQRNKRAKKRLLLADFDELNVISEMDSMYDGLDTDNRTKFKELWAARYLEMMLFLKRKPIPPDDTIDELAEMYLAGLLSEPNEVTHYTYDTEVYRKRDRAKEAINAVNGKVLKQIEMDKHLRYWNRQTVFYTDIVSDDANIAALKDAGVKRVEWVTQKDEKVCEICRGRNGKVYPIDKLPVKPHPSCRCYFRRVD